MECFVDSLRHRCDVERMSVKIIHDAHGHSVTAIMPLPFLKTAARGGEGIVGVQRQKDKLFILRLLELLDRFFGERMPVAHGDYDLCIESRLKRRSERCGLPVRELKNGRLPANCI